MEAPAINNNVLETTRGRIIILLRELADELEATVNAEPAHVHPTRNVPPRSPRGPARPGVDPVLTAPARKRQSWKRRRIE